MYVLLLLSYQLLLKLSPDTNLPVKGVVTNTCHVFFFLVKYTMWLKSLLMLEIDTKETSLPFIVEENSPVLKTFLSSSELFQGISPILQQAAILACSSQSIWQSFCEQSEVTRFLFPLFRRAEQCGVEFGYALCRVFFPSRLHHPYSESWKIAFNADAWTFHKMFSSKWYFFIISVELLCNTNFRNYYIQLLSEFCAFSLGISL